MLKKILTFVVISQSLACSSIPRGQYVAKVPRFLESLLNSSQASDDDSHVKFEDEQDVESQYSDRIAEGAMEIDAAYDYPRDIDQAIPTANPFNHGSYTNTRVQTHLNHHANPHVYHYGQAFAFSNSSPFYYGAYHHAHDNRQAYANTQHTQSQSPYHIYPQTNHNTQAYPNTHVQTHPCHQVDHGVPNSSQDDNGQDNAITNPSYRIHSQGLNSQGLNQDYHHGYHKDPLVYGPPDTQHEKTSHQVNEEFSPLIISNARYIVTVLDRDNIGKRKNSDPETAEYQKARKMLNDLFLELKSIYKVRDVLRKVRNPLGARLETQVRTTIGSPEFLSREEKDKINNLFLQVGYQRIIRVLKKDMSWTRPILPRTVDAVLSSRKYFSETEIQKVIDLFRNGSNDTIMRSRQVVRNRLEMDQSWTRPVRDDVLHKIELDLTTGQMR
ncbi:hypothetical protein ROZALSC1DRAFT_25117 [Rozella allomycis CSF55]|uniref:Uncharacterized protein n=1 Tax=Rozella allomycis (strain CSF55) TaxID=988480 RepID=A0A4V1IZ24_ROZAC|nr:hypothetical protein ROZALSC1DRAFT_25117 [Rozella allomycis CSF55]